MTMQGINVSTSRKKVQTTKSYDLDAPKVLDNIKELMKGRTHPESGLQFAGALLAPHISKDVFRSTVVPTHDKMMGMGGTARDHPIADTMLRMQENIIKGKPKLKETIRNLHEIKNLNEAPDNPFEKMNDKQLYHHVMNMSHPEWAKVQENTGVLAGRMRTRLGGALPRGELQRIVKDHVPGFHSVIQPVGKDDGTNQFDRVSHLMDISMSRFPKHAAERLEREVEGGSFGETLKSSLWLTALADLKKNRVNPP